MFVYPSSVSCMYVLLVIRARTGDRNRIVWRGTIYLQCSERKALQRKKICVPLYILPRRNLQPERLRSKDRVQLEIMHGTTRSSAHRHTTLTTRQQEVTPKHRLISRSYSLMHTPLRTSCPPRALSSSSSLLTHMAHPHAPRACPLVLDLYLWPRLASPCPVRMSRRSRRATSQRCGGRGTRW